MQKLNSKIESFYIESNICGDYPPMFYKIPSKTQKILSLGLNPSLTNDFEDILKLRKLTFKDFIGSKNIEERECFCFPKIKITQVREKIEDYELNDFIIENYEYNKTPLKLAMIA